MRTVTIKIGPNSRACETNRALYFYTLLPEISTLQHMKWKASRRLIKARALCLAVKFEGGCVIFDK
jgi:hypothetical protein